MIQTPFGTLLVATIRLLALLAARFLAAPGAAVPLPAITMTAEIKNHPTRGKMTNPLTKNDLTRNGHRHPEAELDNRCRSWQDDSHTDLEVLDLGPPIKRPRLLQQPGSFVSAFGNSSYQILLSPKTPAAMMLINFKDRLVFKKLRF
jgi:hypothetical protein